MDQDFRDAVVSIIDQYMRDNIHTSAPAKVGNVSENFTAELTPDLKVTTDDDREVPYPKISGTVIEVDFLISPYKGTFRVSQAYRNLRANGTYHQGYDLVGIGDKSIYCPVYGTVIRAGWECATLPKKGFGQRVVVRIGSTAYYMYFGHLSKINVAVGQKLKPGDLIGVEGSTGHSTGSHLHWEIRINDISTGYVSVHQYAGIPNVAGSTAYTSNWVAELFGPSNLKKSTSGFPQRLYNSVLQGALGIDKDGIFGANTEKTVKEFQSAHGLTADGIAGAKTKAALAKQL